MNSISAIFTFILFLLLIPVAILAGRGKIGTKSDSKLRAVFSVIQAGVILLTIAVMFEVFRANFAYFGYNSAYFSVCTPLFVLFYLLMAILAEVASNKFKPALAFFGLTAVCVLAIALYTLSVAVFWPIYFNQTFFASIGLVIACLFHMCNFMLSFKAGWQRITVTLINSAVFLVMSVVLFFVLHLGAEVFTETEGATLSIGAILIVVIIAAVILLPSLACGLSVLSAHFKENAETED